ncbi:amidohydrolase family protein [Halococcus saccharolyticus]|uniref:Amidohydrolase n=1 Tax=Halococcus saccharolyticus DSM 5350 TaxID=1227455 RepID=M0MKE8_9EURY|nr:amidohydrolase family protein [Halococcus saccharolyticus]EMA46126.1 amidohydrolase [Halococcus saccharolyticus DSM 5350]
MIIEGTILCGRELEPIEGRVVIEDDEIVAIEEATVDSSNIVLPAFVNAHTHIGDSIAKEAGGGLSLDELVAPPDGLKHQLLRETSREELVAAMRRTIAFMRETGTGAFCEFREGDVEGVRAIEEALTGSALDATVLGRGSVAAMEASDGYGASGARDDEFARERAATREAGKLFGIHAGERDPHDIDPALDLDPDFLVHMVHAEPDHLDRVGREECPVVVCPRSNLVTGVGLGPIEELTDRTTVALGTDNAMLDSPSMFREMEFTAKLTDVSAHEVLRMATINGADILNFDCGIVEPGREARMLVLDGDSNNLHGARDPVRAVVRRAGVSDVERVVLPESRTAER